MRRVIARWLTARCSILWVFGFVYPVVLASNCLLRAAGDGIEMNTVWEMGIIPMCAIREFARKRIAVGHFLIRPLPMRMIFD